MWKLSRNRFRTLIWSTLQADDPIRHRWLQEHRDRDGIVNQLTSDAMELAIGAHEQRSQTPTTGYWTCLDDTEIEPTVVEMVLGSPELWDQVDEQFARNPPVRTSEDTISDLLRDVAVVPRSAPTGRSSPRQD